MSKSELPLRRCTGCMEFKPKNELFRLCKTKDGVVLDLTYKAQGRGTYVCKNKSCIDIACKKKGFNRTLKGPVSPEVIDKLYKELENET